MKTASLVRRVSQVLCSALVLMGVAQDASSQTPPPAWSFASQFRYNIENVLVDTTVPGTWNVKVIFSITNPTTPHNDPWDIKNALPYQGAGAGLTIDIGWDPSTDFSNTGSANTLLNPVVTTGLGAGAALPIQLRNLNRVPGASRCTDSTDCPGLVDFNNRFWVVQA